MEYLKQMGSQKQKTYWSNLSHTFYMSGCCKKNAVG